MKLAPINGADKDGKLVAMEADWTVDHGPYCEFGDLLTMRGTQFIGAGYDIPNSRGAGRTVAMNHAWGSAFRAYGSPQSLFASEVLADMKANGLRRILHVMLPQDRETPSQPTCMVCL